MNIKWSLRHDRTAAAYSHPEASPWFPPGKTTLRLLPILRQALTYNQGAYLQYSYTAFQLHKDIRQALLVRPLSVEALEARLSALDAFLDEGLETVLGNMFRLLDVAFYTIDPYAPLPRMCVKANKKEHGTELIFDLYRYYPAPEGEFVTSGYVKEPFPVVDNTGFNHVATTGSYFLAPDIPRAVLNGYKNPRLDDHKAHRYKPPSILTRMLSRRDQAWEGCWKTYDSSGIGTTPADACYKSTLIIPVGLSKDQLTSEMLELIHRSFPSATDLQVLIFAYLCFDHTSAHYFSKSVHVDLGYMFANMLCLYFSTKWVLTAGSATYGTAYRRIWQPSAGAEYDG